MRITILACAAALAMPASALADTTIEAQTVWRFDASTYMLDKGGRLTFKNDDSGSPGPHNVTANDNGSDGRPLFSSETIKNGEQAAVKGADALPPGQYGFFCSVHPFMTATLVVADRSAPAPAPAQPKPTAAATGPKVRASLLRTSLRAALRARRVVASIASDESAALDATLTAKVGSRTLTVGHAHAAGRTVRLAVPLNAAGRRALRHARRATLTLYVEARDSDGNLTAIRTHRALRR